MHPQVWNLYKCIICKWCEDRAGVLTGWITVERGSAGSDTVCPFKCHMWTVWCCLQARRPQEEVVCVSKCSVWWRSAEHPTGPAWENKHIFLHVEKNTKQKWCRVPDGSKSAGEHLAECHTAIREPYSGCILKNNNMMEKHQSYDVTNPEKRSQLFLCPVDHIHYHFKVKLCVLPPSFFVCPLVVQHNIFNRPLQDYIINKTLASLCFISCSHSLTHTHIHTAWWGLLERLLMRHN